MQGEKGISLTGLLSCTIDSMEIGGREGGREGRQGMTLEHWAKDGTVKAETTNAVHFNM